MKIPAANVWKLSPEIPREFGSLFDPFGNAVHTALSGPIGPQTVAVTIPNTRDAPHAFAIAIEDKPIGPHPGEASKILLSVRSNR